jgi:hypothetical protein
MATTVRLLSNYTLSGVPYAAGDLVSIGDTLATQLNTGKIVDSTEAAITQAEAEGKAIQYPAIDQLVYGRPTDECQRTITVSEDACHNDQDKLIIASSASAIILTILSDQITGWYNGELLSLYQAGAGEISFAAGTDVTLRTPVGIPTAVQYGTISAMRIGPNEWTLV